jgi:acyl dehydratase
MASLKHILHQGPVIASLGRTALAALRQQRGGGAGGPAPATPGPLLETTIAPRPAELVRDYLREVGGDRSAWRGALPPHLFAQWGFPLAARTLEAAPYPLFKVLNGGCRLEVNGRLPDDQPLRVTARLEDIDDDGRRAVLHQRVTTGTAAEPELVVAHLYAIVPLKKKAPAPSTESGSEGGHASPVGRSSPPANAVALGTGEKKTARVPEGARELAFWKLRPENAMSFAILTGDFNPVHWVKPYARAFGFKSVILHGFATLARTYEGLARHLYAGQVDRLATLDVKFTRPLVLPARVGLYVDGDAVFVGDAPGGPAYLTGRFTATSPGVSA